jgi:hypothetical protein
MTPHEMEHSPDEYSLNPDWRSARADPGQSTAERKEKHDPEQRS